MSEPIIFISYSRADGTEHALNLEKDLKSMGGKVWIDKKGIQPGTYYDDEIEKALTESTYVLYVLTKESSNSKQVKSEIRYAMDEDKIVIPLNFSSNFKKPYFISLLQFIDFTNNYPEGLEQLSRYLNLKQDLTEKKGIAETVPAVKRYRSPAAPGSIPEKKISVSSTKKISKPIAVKTGKQILQPVADKPAENAFKLDKSYLYEFEKDATWWLLLPVVITLNIAAVYYGAQLFNYLLSVINLTYLQYHFSWTLIIISGTVWGIVSSLVAGSNATIKADMFFSFFIPFDNIFYSDDIMRGLFSSFFINIILISAVAAGSGYWFHNLKSLEWDYNTVFLTSYITISLIAVFSFFSEDCI